MSKPNHPEEGTAEGPARTSRRKPGLFPALLKHWRGSRGMSQLDLALAADVSSRHVSFLETGRAGPSAEMVLRLGAALAVPLRDRNTMLAAAGFEEMFDDPGVSSGLGSAVGNALDRMLSTHEPFPMVVMDRHYNVLRTNGAATSMMQHIIAEPTTLNTPVNTFRMLFDPRLARPFIRDWERVAHGLIAALHIESLQHPNDVGLCDLLRVLHEYPDVPQAWRQPDPSRPADAVFTVVFQRDDLHLAFLTTVTRFNAPTNITLEELRIESYFPVDDATEAACRRLGSG
jgi:transcriptional regulator with XRE-family HTH domain